MTQRKNTGLEVAVIGMSGRFPGAEDVWKFWENLKNGVESIAFFTPEELENEGIDSMILDNPNFVRARGVLHDIEYFDAAFFGYTPSEAELMDPQTRIFYEVVWSALENAGYSPDIFDGTIGVFAGATNNRTWEGRAILSGKAEAMGNFAADGYIDRDFLSTRMAYKLNLRGPAITMKTACSSSLVAVDVACRMLLTGQCDMAVAGGVSVHPQRKKGYFHQEGMIYSPDGHVRAFDALGKGVVFSDGVGVVILKRLEEAIADGDQIWAVILGSALNNDGARKGSYSAPSSDGHEDVIQSALFIAEVDPEDISYVETHGTATTLGDPVEIEGLKRAYKTDKRGYCPIGSVKSNVGHLDTAAGIASFIKTVLSLKNQYIPPSLFYTAPNPEIDFDNSPFFVNAKLQEWKRGDKPRRAGVSSFGVGGTNAHAIVEEAPQREPSSPSRENQLILLSAKTEGALNEMSVNFANYLKENPGLTLADAAYTLKLGRSAFKHRQMLVARTIDEVINALTPLDDKTPYDTEKVFRSAAKEEVKPVFMFSGQGSQYINMGLDLYRKEPEFANEMDRCFDIFRSMMRYDIKDILYPFTHLPNPSESSAQSDINRTEIAQPVIFIIEYALASLLIKWGIKPFAMIGHSIGEYTAACISGVFSLEDAIKVVALRGKLMQQMSAGSMLSVPLSEAEVLPLLTDQLELAAVNAPNLCVVSGPVEAINQLADRLQKKNLQVRHLHTSHAFHSKSMEPMLKNFEAEVGKITLNKPEIPYISNLTGKWITVEEAVNPGYWARHLRHTVRFADGLTELLKNEDSLLVEVGPGLALTTFVRQHPHKKPDQKTVNLVRHPKDNISDTAYFLDKLGRLWLGGQWIDWKAFYSGERRYRTSLPTYPFQRQMFWITHEVFENLNSGSFEGGSKGGRKKDIENWYYLPSWKRSLLPDPGIFSELKNTNRSFNWLLFMDDCGIGLQLVQHLQQSGHQVVIVNIGTTFARTAQGEFALGPNNNQDYMTLFNILGKEKMLPHRVLHLWNVTSREIPGWGSEWNEAHIERYLDIGFYSLLYLAQAIGKQNINDEMRITVFTNRAQEVMTNETICPGKAAVLGPINVIPQEFPNVFCSMVDLVLPPGGDGVGESRLLRQLMEEISSETADVVVAYRGNYRLVQHYEAVTINQTMQEMPRIKQGGIYLVTGGLGGIGLVLSRYLAQNAQAKLILTGRSAFPAREEWDQWLSTHLVNDSLSDKIRKVKELEKLGAQVNVFSVDVTDYQGMKEVVAQTQEQWGPINGVIHAAGLPGGGIIRLKTREIADSVLLPKIKGTLVLDTLLQGIPLDFILVCSSINSVVPTLGQVDYFGANAFLDAYAFYKNTADGIFTLSVNWDAWQEVGMAVAAAKDTSLKSTTVEPMPLEHPHPLFEAYIPGREGRRKYIGHMSLKTSWPLLDHMTFDGKGLLPGTTYLEMARAAWENYSGKIPVELFDVTFLTPMIVAGDQIREYYLELEPQGDYFQFVVESTIPTEIDFRQKHVIGKLRVLEKEMPLPYDIDEVQSRCNIRQFFAKYEDKEEAKPVLKDGKPENLVIFGPHWHIGKWIKVGKNEGLRLMELPDKFLPELEHYKLHPSILDSATGFLFGYVYEGSAYIPFYYRRLRLYRPLPAKTFSYSRLIGDRDKKRELLRFDVVVLDEEGNVCAEVEEFTMMEVSDDVRSRIYEREHLSMDTLPVKDSSLSTEELNERQRFLLRIGILPSEGVDVFRRLLAISGGVSQVVVSTIDLPLRIERQKMAVRKQAEDQQETSRAPKYARTEISSAYAEPRNELEKKITEIFQNQLGISGVGINDDFFELGGDSLKAIALTGKIQKAFHKEVPLTEFFNHPTVKKMSQFLTGKETEEMPEVIKPVEKRDFYTLSAAQERLFVLYRLTPQNTGYNLFRGIELSGENVKEEIEEVIKKIIQRHECLRTSFALVDGKPVQRVHEQVEFKLQYYDLVGQGGSKSEIIGNFIRPFQLEIAPLMRVGLIKVAEKKYILAFDFHHIITDAHSMLVIFVGDIHALYGKETLPPLALQYKDFSGWQNRQRNSPAVKKHEAFWLEEFKGGVPALNLPFDHERPAGDSYLGDWVIFRLNASETLAFREMLLEQEATLFMGLVALYNILLNKLSGQDDIVIGTPTAGRNHPDLQPVMGMFVNMLVLRNFPGGEKTFRHFLKEVKERLLNAFSHQDYQFEMLVEKLALERKPGRNPLFDVNLTLQNVAEVTASPGDADPDVFDIENRASKFDLSLEIIEISEFLHCKFEYKTQLFNRETIERYAAYFKEILAAVVKEKDIRLSDIRLSHDLLESTAEAPEMEFKF